MKLLTACCAVALLASISGFAQTTAGSTVVGRMTVTTTVSPSSWTGTASTRPKTVVNNDLLILRGGNGQIEYQMSVGGIQVVQTDGSIDNVATGEVVNAVAAEAVRQGTQLGYTSGSTQTSVRSESDVVRYGSGENTEFDAASTNQIKRVFYVSGSSSAPTVQYIGTTTTESSTSTVQ